MLAFLLLLLGHVVKLFGKCVKNYCQCFLCLKKKNGLRWTLRVMNNYLLSFSYLQTVEISVEK